ncbi:hypothetical protein GMORB2_7814 [Geosmithia morbida]|uniref:F-box domain-containing protein n=1 Tax=Geosmithia morbida TaxID=1094350 RepID=A0A9P5D365_9HYPO|nr:uncharacterized protein GMORB2_7814 [Geosmithia morbida]KAF4122221.1 hypothetical protein GMORB2_7814 [Geosmithia morbida]
MLQSAIPDRPRFDKGNNTSTPASSNPLLDTLFNRLVLEDIVSYLPISALLNLAATNRDFRGLVYESPGIFRHLDLSTTKAAQFEIEGIDRGGQVWRNVQLDEYLSEDDFYSGPLRGIFAKLQRPNILQDVQILVLDGLSVTAELCNDIITSPAYSVRILSVRDAKNLNQGKLRGALQYACRGSRPEGTPRLKALYVFGSKDSIAAPASSADKLTISAEWNHKSQQALSSSLSREIEPWWSKKGRIISKHAQGEWAQCLLACDGVIAFDAVLCYGPRHRNSHLFGKIPSTSDSTPAIATFAIPPCSGCGASPEGLTEPFCATRDIPGRLPLLAPPPTLSSSVRAATTPRLPAEAFVPRCLECLRDRYCTCCHQWWCETCYTPPSQSHNACESCIEKTQKVCRRCYSGYCIIHNEGSSSTFGVFRAGAD